MKRYLLVLAASAGLAAASLPASANVVTYTLNCSTVTCASPTSYGTVKLDDHGSTGTVTVTVSLAPNTFAGTGAGYAINWNIDPGHPALTTTLSPTDIANSYDHTHFTVLDSTDGSTTYSASTFGSGWEYAIDYNQHGGNASNDNKLIFDVGLSGLTIANFVPNSGFMFVVDIWEKATGNTFVVAAKVPEPATWLMFFAGLAGLTFLFQRRRKFVRAV